MALAFLAACSTTPRAPPGNVSRLPPGNSQRDGPDANPPPGLWDVPDAVPQIEPVRVGGPNKPYEVDGQTYVPITDDRAVVERGLASWYGRKFHGHRTSSGEAYNMYAMTAAHKTLPIPSYARVRNPANGREVIVRVNDRGPFASGRIIDLSYTAALKLGVLGGVQPVEVERITDEDIRTGAAFQHGGTRLAAASPAPAAVSPRGATTTTTVVTTTTVAALPAGVVGLTPVQAGGWPSNSGNTQTGMTSGSPGTATAQAVSGTGAGPGIAPPTSVAAAEPGRLPEPAAQASSVPPGTPAATIGTAASSSSGSPGLAGQPNAPASPSTSQAGQVVVSSTRLPGQVMAPSASLPGQVVALPASQSGQVAAPSASLPGQVVAPSASLPGQVVASSGTGLTPGAPPASSSSVASGSGAVLASTSSPAMAQTSALPPLREESARAETPGGAGYWVQIGAYRQRTGALDFQHRLVDEQPWLAPLLAVFSENGLNRLQAGPYGTREDARNAAERIRIALQLVPTIVEKR